MYLNQRLFLALFVCFGLTVPFLQADQSTVQLVQSDVAPMVDVATVYLHGFTGNPEGGLTLLPIFPNPKKFYAPTLPDAQPSRGFNFNRLISLVANYWNKHINRSQAYMGQSRDIDVVAAYVKQHLNKQPFVLFGCCRGAAAIINYVAVHNPKNLKAIVLEAAPESMPATLHPRLAARGVPIHWDETVFRCLFPAYPKGSTPPIDRIKKIKNKALPILIVHSRTDTIVPFAHSLKLYTTFKKHGFNNVYLVVAKGDHAYLFRDDPKTYLQAVHTFYRCYGLTHNPMYATGNMKHYEYDLAQAEKELTVYQETLDQQVKDKQSGFAKWNVGSTRALAVIASMLLHKN